MFNRLGYPISSFFFILEYRFEITVAIRVNIRTEHTSAMSFCTIHIIRPHGQIFLGFPRIIRVNI